VLVGMGGLGAAAALYLAGAGVGQLSLIDADEVEASNLHRQVIFDEASIGTAKVLAARQKLLALNPHIHVTAHPTRLNASNAATLLTDAAMVLDCSDNFATRFLLNDWCVAARKPLISASVQGFAGQLATFQPGRACYRCLFPQTPIKGMVPTCPEAGVFGPIVGMMGVLQASEALKLLAGLHPDHDTVFLTVDALTLNTTRLTLPRNPACPACAQGRGNSGAGKDAG